MSETSSWPSRRMLKGAEVTTEFMALLCAVLFVCSLFLTRAATSRYTKQLDLGDKYLNELEYDKAILAYETAVNIDARKTDAYDKLCSLYMEQHNYTAVVQVATYAVQHVWVIEQPAMKELVSKAKEEQEAYDASAAGQVEAPAEQEQSVPEKTVDMDSEEAAIAAAETLGYKDIRGETFSADGRILSGVYVFPEQVHFPENGLLGYAFYDFDKDGQNELLLATVESQMLTGDGTGFDPYYDDLDSPTYDLRLHMLEDQGGEWAEQSQLSYHVGSIPMECKMDWFYKDYGDFVGIYFNAVGDEFADDGGRGSMVQFKYLDSGLQMTNIVLENYPGDIGYCNSQEALSEIESFEGGGWADTWQSFGFPFSSGYAADPPMTEVDPATCIRISRITSAPREYPGEGSYTNVNLSGLVNVTVER